MGKPTRKIRSVSTVQKSTTAKAVPSTGNPTRTLPSRLSKRSRSTSPRETNGPSQSRLRTTVSSTFSTHPPCLRMRKRRGMLTLKISSRQTSRSVTTFENESFQEPFYSSPAKLLKRTTSTKKKMRAKTAKRKVRRRKMIQTSIPPRSRTHRSASSSSHLALTSTDQNNLSWNSRCVYCNFSHFFYPTATLNLLTMLLDHYAESVYVPSKDVYFVALYYYYGKFTELTQ